VPVNSELRSVTGQASNRLVRGEWSVPTNRITGGAKAKRGSGKADRKHLALQQGVSAASAQGTTGEAELSKLWNAGGNRQKKGLATG